MDLPITTSNLENAEARVAATTVGVITVVGVGPGDPELITVAALRAIRRATLVAYPVARAEAEGMAARIAATWLRPRQQRLPLVFPMVAEAEPRRKAWAEAAETLAAAVAAGERVVFLCEGDPSLFASASYLLLALRQHHTLLKVQVIPGITAVAAAAAVGRWPLALQQESLLICPTPDSAAELEQLLRQATASDQQLAMLKLGHRWPWVRQLLEQQDLLHTALFAERVGWPDAVVLPAAAVSAEQRPYFSLLLVRVGWPGVLP
jgi:precorrin-2/cobalt-factor-2 C20-methyltransferase